MSAFLHPKLRDLSGHFLKFFIGELREPLQLTHKGIKRLLLIQPDDLSVEVDNDAGYDGDHEYGVDGQYDGYTFGDKCCYDDVAESGGGDNRIAVPQSISVSMDIRLGQIDDKCGRENEEYIAGQHVCRTGTNENSF